MISIERVVSPEVLENREFHFSSFDKNQIQNAKTFGKKLRGMFINNGNETMIWHLEVIW